uniref:Uncharacterized protein n=1 Tax=Panagrolaimus superbus TaxID=310955 RepID=A0A914Y8K2_9BILA
MKKIILTLVIFNSFLLLSASAPSEEFGDFMRNALIVADGVIESGVIDFSQNIANGEFSAASIEVYKIMGKVIKAKIPETDPNVKLAMEMKKTFQEVTGSYARAIQTELHDFATQAALYNVLDGSSS